MKKSDGLGIRIIKEKIKENSGIKKGEDARLYMAEENPFNFACFSVAVTCSLASYSIAGNTKVTLYSDVVRIM